MDCVVCQNCCCCCFFLLFFVVVVVARNKFIALDSEYLTYLQTRAHFLSAFVVGLFGRCCWPWQLPFAHYNSWNTSHVCSFAFALMPCDRHAHFMHQTEFQCTFEMCMNTWMRMIICILLASSVPLDVCVCT